VPKKALDIYLPGLLLDRPGGERVTEAVRVYLGIPHSSPSRWKIVRIALRFR